MRAAREEELCIVYVWGGFLRSSSRQPGWRLGTTCKGEWAFVFVIFVFIRATFLVVIISSQFC